MRLRIFGVPKTVLFAFGLTPLLVWLVFHFSGHVFKKDEMIWVGSLAILASALFTFTFARGLFESRMLIYSLVFLETCIELVRAVSDRDFLNLFVALVIFALNLLLAIWVEARVKTAYLSPAVKWFEGDPQFYPHVVIEVTSGETTAHGRLSRIDRTGFFVHLDRALEGSPKKPLEFKLQYRDQPVEGKAVVQAHFFGDKQGLGLQFLPKDLYHLIQYTALVQRIRGEGL